MNEELYRTCLKSGYPALKKTSGLPSYFLPERSFNTVVDQLGATRTLEASRPLGLDTGCLPYSEEHGVREFSKESWQDACLNWPQLSLVVPVTGALMRATDRITGLYYRGELRADPFMVGKSLMVLFLAPFAPGGRQVLTDLADALQGSPTCPAGLINCYTDAIVSYDASALARVYECITRYPEWWEWASVISDEIIQCPVTPRLVAITPPLSNELADILAAMVREGVNDGS